uniref:PDZ domain-containing protein n=1 Tax=Clastoptera arizonana TaxID=38151 RepID=A0A1B6DRB8_9HEMI
MVFNARKKMSTLSSCFAQLTHKAQTIFQKSAKLEAELINMRAEIVETKTRNQSLEEELHAILVQLHTTKLQNMSGEDGVAITNKLHKGLMERSPTHKAVVNGLDVDTMLMSLENWKCRLEVENESLRNSLVNLQAEVCGARLAARYLDKELAGRIQQLQLLGRSDMTGEARDKLWSQLEAEILVQRHKTVMRAVRQKDHRAPPSSSTGTVRTVELHRHPNQGLGISITGGREHGVPILISELEPGGDTSKLYVGDSVLSVNGIDLSQASHQEAVKLLSSQMGNVTLKVQYLSNGGDESEEDADLTNLRYGFFHEPNESSYYRINGFGRNIKNITTPTAPRTPDPDSFTRAGSEYSYSCSPSNLMLTEDLPINLPSSDLIDPPSSQTNSPLNIGVTTLQKIFKSLTPSAVRDSSTDKQGWTESDVKSKDSKTVTETTTFQVLDSSPKITLETKTAGKDTSQLFHPETEAMTLVNGLGDASFGTPV